MDRYTLILVTDERSPVQRFQIPKFYVKRGLIGLAVVALLGVIVSWDYWRKTMDNAELAGLRIEAAEQREQIESFKRTLATVEQDLSRVRELERKVRIIANLPGAAAVGGAEVTELVPASPAGHEGGVDALPAGVPIEFQEGGQGGADLELPIEDIEAEAAQRQALTTAGARYVRSLDALAVRLNGGTTERGDSLELLLTELESKRVKLSSMPSIWPAKGWLTSRYGTRIGMADLALRHPHLALHGPQPEAFGARYRVAQRHAHHCPGARSCQLCGPKGAARQHADARSRLRGSHDLWPHQGDPRSHGPGGRARPVDRLHREHGAQHRAPPPLCGGSQRPHPRSPRLHLRLRVSGGSWASADGLSVDGCSAGWIG